jgi:hypothetical protein
VTVLSGQRAARKERPIATPSYITKPTGFCWHILRPNERHLVRCQADLDGPTWIQITLTVPASVCPMCIYAESVSLTPDLDRVF